MKTFGTLTLLALAAAVGLTSDALAQAAVDYKPGEKVGAAVDYRPGEANGLIGLLNTDPTGRKPGELVPAVMPTDQKPNFVGEAYGTVLGRDAGDERGVIAIRKAGGLEAQGFSWGESQTIPTGQQEQKVQEAYGALLGRDTGGSTGELVPAVMPNDQKVQKVNGLGSLSGLGSTNDLFANSRGGDQGPGLLLPAVQKVRKAGGDPSDQVSLNFTKVDPTNPNTGAGGPSPHVKIFDGRRTGNTQGLNFNTPNLNLANQGATGGSGPTVSPGAVKSLNFATTPR